MLMTKQITSDIPSPSGSPVLLLISIASLEESMKGNNANKIFFKWDVNQLVLVELIK